MRRLRRTLLIALSLLLLLLILGPFLIPVSPATGTLPPELLADPDSLFVQVNGLSVHYKALGHGEPALVLLHGFGSSTFSWRDVLPDMAQFGKVIAFDRPAFGLTERPLPETRPAANPYTLDAQVDLTIALLDTLGVQETILVGHSAGGTVALLTALRHPQRVKELILIAPAVYGGGGSPAWFRPLLALPQVRRLGPLLVRLLVRQLEGALPSAWHDPSKITPEVMEGYKKPLKVDNWDRSFWDFTTTSRPSDIEAHLGSIAIRTLVITGDDDRWVPTDQSVRLAGELPNADLVVIPSCGHVAHEECPQEFLSAVAAFLRTEGEE